MAAGVPPNQKASTNLLKLPVLLRDTDRSITGQDGVEFDSAAAADPVDSFPARLASRLFAGVIGVVHVFVASNQVVVGRPEAWDGDAVASASDIVSGFFVFYPHP